MRDDFKESTKKYLAKKAGYICSYPQCRMGTTFCKKASGAYIGQAAHITAASPGGPRYDPSLTNEQRSDASNGIWMCYSHAKLIDSEKCSYPADKLRMWKCQHEKDVAEGRFSDINTDTAYSCRYIRKLTVKGLGPFVDECEFPFGRMNFLVGGTGCGKTALTQMACWFVGCAGHEYIRKRFLEGCRNDNAMLSAEYGECDHFRKVSYDWSKYRGRLLLNANCSRIGESLAVRSGQRVLVIDDDYEVVTKVKTTTGFRHIVSGFGNLIGMDCEDLMALIASRGEYETPIGYRFKLLPNGKNLECERCRDGFYQEYNSLSGTEQMLATLDIALRCVDLVPPGQSWLFVIEHRFVERLADNCENLFKDLLFSLPPNIQLMICVLYENTIDKLLDGRKSKFVRHKYGGLSLWTSNDDY